MGWGVEGAVINLGWSANQEPDLAGYRLYYSPSSFQQGNVWTTLSQIKTDPSFIQLQLTGPQTLQVLVPNLSSGNTYYFRLSAYNTQGSESGLNVDAQGQDTEVSGAPSGDTTVDAGMFSPGNQDGINDGMQFPLGTTEVSVRDTRGILVWRAEDPSGSQLLTWFGDQQGGRRLPSGLYLAEIKDGNGKITYHKVVVVR
jgi:hypothetical protein